MEQSASSDLKAQIISRENTKSRRFSASSLKSFRDDERCLRSTTTISSTASSPGYMHATRGILYYLLLSFLWSNKIVTYIYIYNVCSEEIDPSTYSFTAALKGIRNLLKFAYICSVTQCVRLHFQLVFYGAALQAKAVYSWEYLPSHRLTLHSKWSDAEKYISNPLSGEVPLECLSAKTLSARSFSNRITISAPLVYQTNYPIIQHQHKLNITIQGDHIYLYV